VARRAHDSGNIDRLSAEAPFGQRPARRGKPNGAAATLPEIDSNSPGLITVCEFAGLARLSRRQIDRLRSRPPKGFPHEYEMGTSDSKNRRCPRFKLQEVLAWLNSRRIT